MSDALPIGPDAYVPDPTEVEAILAQQLSRRPGPTPGAARLDLKAPAAATKRLFDAIITAAWALSLRGQDITAAAVHAELPKSKSKHAIQPSVAQVQSVLESAIGRRALADRGLALADEQELTYAMVATIRALVDPRPLSHAQRLRLAGVTASEYQGFLTYPRFRQTLQESTEVALKGGIAEANAALTRNVQKGDLKAIQYLHQLTGYWDPNKQQTLDVQQVIQEMMTIVFKRVTDPTVLLALAADFELLKRSIDMADGMNDAARPAGAAVDMANLQELEEITASLGGVPDWSPPTEALEGLETEQRVGSASWTPTLVEEPETSTE